MSKKQNDEKKADLKEEENVNDTQGEEEELTGETEQCEQQEEKKELTEEEEAINVKYMRLAADFQNYKRRVEKEKSDIYAYANEKIVLELLDVIDNFERALDHKADGAESYTEGMGKIFKQLKGVLDKSGVEEITAVGEDFDPNFHHAVLTENSVEFESGKVTLVLQKGYKLNERVIRPAMVKVAE